MDAVTGVIMGLLVSLVCLSFFIEYLALRIIKMLKNNIRDGDEVILSSPPEPLVEVQNDVCAICLLPLDKGYITSKDKNICVDCFKKERVK